MTAFAKLLTAAVAAGALAAPAAAQSTYPYPYPQPYPPDYGYSNPGANVVGSIIDQLLGNRYNVTDRTAVSQCANAALRQAAREYGPDVYGYDQWGDQGYGYAQGYGYNGYGGMRVTAITDVERRTLGLRVRGLIDSGMGYRPYGNYGYVDPRYGTRGDLNFRCTVDYRGNVTDVRVRREEGYRRY